jgi:hypothetical protein
MYQHLLLIIRIHTLRDQRSSLSLRQLSMIVICTTITMRGVSDHHDLVPLTETDLANSMIDSCVTMIFNAALMVMAARFAG